MKELKAEYWINDANELKALDSGISPEEYQMTFDKLKQSNPDLIYCYEVEEWRLNLKATIQAMRVMNVTKRIKSDEW